MAETRIQDCLVLFYLLERSMVIYDDQVDVCLIVVVLHPSYIYGHSYPISHSHIIPILCKPVLALSY